MKRTIPVVIEIKENEGAVWVGDSLIAVIPLRFADLPSILEEVRRKVFRTSRDMGCRKGGLVR